MLKCNEKSVTFSKYFFRHSLPRRRDPNRRERSGFRQTLSAKPTAQKEARTEDPPALMKGNVTPMTGDTPMHIPILIKD